MYPDVGNEPKWWLIPAKPRSLCTGCGHGIPAKTAAAYCHERSELMCTVCIDSYGIDAQPSRRWLAQQTRSHVDRDVLAVACPRTGCESPAGELCIDRSENYKTQPHAARKRLAAGRTQRPTLRIVKDEAS